MKVSVVSCTWNRAPQTYYGIHSLINQTNPAEEIILVDDGSTDETKHVVAVLQEEAEEKGIEFVYKYLGDHPEARISCFPRNVGLRLAKHEIVCFTEPEVLHIGDTISQVREKIKEYPDTVYVAGQIWTMGGSIWQKFHFKQRDYLLRPATILTHPFAQLTQDPNKGNTKAPDADWAVTGQNDCFAGCLFGTLKQHFLECRGFDEEMTEYGWDDWDLIHRVLLYTGKDHNRGVESRKTLCNDIKVIHQWHRKNYPYNIYDAAERNGQISEDRLKRGEWKANTDNEKWGLL